MERWAGKVAIVTGASAGIGAAISVKLAENGLKVVGLARRSERIEELNKEVKGQKVGKIYARSCDLTVEEEVLNSIKWVKDNIGEPHVLVNNASWATHGLFIDTPSNFWKQTFDVNVLSVAVLTREFVKHVIEKNIEGHVIAISSSSAGRDRILPGTNAITASKRSLQALQEVVRQELSQTKNRTKITTVCPGPTETESFEEAAQQIGDLLQIDSKTIPRMKAEDVADAVVFALAAPQHVEIRQVVLEPLNLLT